MNRTERLFQRGELFLSQGQPHLAAAEYHRLATRHPRSGFAPNALYKLAYLHREEFDNPRHAIATYQFLAERYPGSPYADEAWLWVLQIQGEKLKDLAAMRRTRDIIRERFSSDERVCAVAQLQLARSLLAAGDLKGAEAEARVVPASYPEQHRQGAAALLVAARALEKRGGRQSDAAVSAYEQIINRYPDTPGAVEAKRAIGWTYFVKRGEEKKAEQLAKVRAARVIPNVPAPVSVNSPRLAPFAALSSLLAAQGVEASPEALLVVCGAALDFWFEPDRPHAPRMRLSRDALMNAAEQYGFSTNVNSMPSADGAFNGLSGTIAAGHPVMIPLAGSSEWAVVSGYKPAEDVVYVLEAGRQRPAAMSRSQFLQRWARSGSGHVKCVTGPHFQLSLGARGQRPPMAAVLGEVGHRAAECRGGVSAGYDRLSEHLAGRPGSTNEQSRRNLREWAERRLAEVLAERLAVARFLRQNAGAAAQAGPAEEAALAYESCVRTGQQLRRMVLELTAPAEGAESPAEATWPEAADLARQMAAAEDRALQQLAALAR